MTKRAFSLKQAANHLGLKTKHSVLYWLRVHGADHYITDNGRIFLTDRQLEALRIKRQEILSRKRGNTAQTAA